MTPDQAAHIVQDADVLVWVATLAGVLVVMLLAVVATRALMR